MEQAAALALIGLALLASGMRIGRGRVSAQFYGDAYLDLATVSPPRLSLVYALSFALKILLTNVMWLSPGLTQFIVPLIALQSAVVFLVFVAATHDRRFRSLAYLVAVVELAFSFTGFFANFKEVFFLAFIALATRIGALPSVTKRLLPVAAALLLLLGAGWQAVKIDYRSFLTAGAETQVITAPISERVEYLAHAISSVNASDLMNGLSTMATRLGYLDYFAYALETVPDYISHQYGRLWLESFERVMQPRFLFPDKPIVDDSVRTRQYTGLAVAGADEGASIGLDYFTESYIDFGRYLMFGPIFLVGIMWGKIYRWFARRSKYRLIDIAVATTLIVPNAIFLERSTIKLVGGTLSACMVTFVATVFLCRPLAALLQNFRKGR